MANLSRIAVWGALVFVALAAACASGPYRIILMPAPDVYEEGVFDPFQGRDKFHADPDSILYATLREPVGDSDGRTRFYASRRGHVLRLGHATIRLGDADITFEEARRISLLKNRGRDYPLQVDEVEEFGILDRSVTVLDDQALKQPEPARRFADQVDENLARSVLKDVVIYVHGYKVNFENPLLVSSELWHFMGFQGAFIAFSWPSTPKTLAYAVDTETAEYSSHGLRTLIKFLSEETRAERIHVLGYSAGTRVVAGAIHQLALMHSGRDREQRRQRLRLGNVIMVGSDVDRDRFGGYLLDGIASLPASLTIYMSSSDKALGISRWFFAQDRIGQSFDVEQMQPALIDLLRRQDQLRIIDVTNAEGSATGNGHAYFRSSPWVSSDVLMTLMHDLAPEERGLVRDEGTPVWEFPADYIARLRGVLTDIYPQLNAASD